jgi:hypothetical protein
MTFASSFQAAVGLSAFVAIVGCGSSTSSGNAFKNNGNGTNAYGADATSGDDGGGGGGGSSGGYSSSSGSGGGTSSSNGGGSACPSSCSTDSDCQNSCPAVTNGLNCCDTASSTCFSTQMAACPAPTVGAAE